MAEYSNNYTQNTTSYTFGTEVYKFSRTVDIINPSAIDNSCIYCGAENGSMYDYYPTYNLGAAEKTIMNNHWSASGGKFNFLKSATDTPFNITFVKCGETGTAAERGRNTVYQIGKTIYNKASSATNSSMRVLNPTDIRKLIFRPSFDGYTASPSSTFDTVDLKYLMDHPDDFFVQQMTMTVYAWNGSTFTTDSEINSIRPCIVGENYFIPVINVLGKHIFGMTDYNSRRDYTQSFYGTYDKDNMPMSFVPILTDETLTYDPNGSSGGSATPNHNKWKWSYNYYNSSYEIHAPARQVLQLMAYCGCYFIDNSYSTSGKTLNTMWNDDHIYLGEMKAGARTTGNFIKGTDLLTSDTINKGEFSSQTEFTPGGGGTGDKIDDMNINPLWAMSSDAGFARYFLMSHDQLASLMTWLSDTTFPDGYDPYAYIISLLQFPLKLSPNWCMPRTPAGHIVIGGEDTGITASLISNEKAWVGAGTYDVPQLNGNFLDYDPYTQYELYIPCCAWVSLPDIVCGRKIAVKINYDLTTAAIIGNVYVTIDGKEMIVASKSGMMGRETIVTGEAQGVRSAQITSALLSAGTGALNVATGAISGNAVAAVSGGYNIVAGLAQANIAANSAYTRTIGSTGGRALLCQFDQCYLKICTTRADIPNNYGHTCGYVCNLKGKVSEFTGYTVFDNVDVSGIGKATDREKKLIKQILESGVIINPTE